MLISASVSIQEILHNIAPSELKELISHVIEHGFINEDTIVDMVEENKINLTTVLGKIAIKKFYNTVTPAGN